MSHHPRQGTLLPQDTDFDSGADQPGIAQPISQTEIEDLLYGDTRPIADRLQRLNELRDEAAARASGDIGGDDAQSLVNELEAAIEALQRDEDIADETAEFAGLEPALESDPEDHLDALAPDDIDARSAVTGEDEDLPSDDYIDDLEQEDLATLDGDARERAGRR